MYRDNCVVFKGKKDGIIIHLDSKADFETIKDTLRKKVWEAQKFFGRAKTPISFKGRSLAEEEEEQLLDIIFNESNLNISFVKGHEDAPALASFAAEDPAPKPEELPTSGTQEQMTFYHRGGLRNGQSIRYPGCVVVLGDVNPGGEIIAGGNIIVLGTLKGLVHAGCKGDRDCYVSALSLTPTQLRIADIITYIPRDVNKKDKTRLRTVPSYANISDGQIYIAPLTDNIFV